MMYTSRAEFPNQDGLGSGPSSAIHTQLPKMKKVACSIAWIPWWRSANW